MVEMSETDQVQINFRASQSQKEAWKAEAEEQGFKSFSDFIRVAVESYTADRERPVDSGMSGSEATELINQTKRLNNRLDTIEDEIALIQLEVESDGAIADLTHLLFDLLPDEKPGTVAWEERIGDLEYRIGDDDDRRITISGKEARNAWEGTVEGLSTATDEPEYHVRKAIDKLHQDTTFVHTAEVDGQQRYWKEV